MRTNEELLTSGHDLIKDYILTSANPEAHRLDVWIDVLNLKAAVKTIIENHWGYLISIGALDHPPVFNEANDMVEDGKIEGLYFFANEAAILTIRVNVLYSNPVIDSICEIIPSATIYEREFIELFGVKITDTPDTSRLVLPDVWPENTYPLRKSFKGLEEENVIGKEE